MDIIGHLCDCEQKIQMYGFSINHNSHATQDNEGRGNLMIKVYFGCLENTVRLLRVSLFENIEI